MKIFTLFFLLLFTIPISAQITSEDTVLMHIRSLKFSILDPFEPYSKSYLFSYEHQFGQHFSLLAEAGFTNGSAWSGSKRKETNGHKMRIELRRYGPVRSNSRFYFGLQYMHKKLAGDDFRDKFSGGDILDPNDPYYKFGYLKKVNALHLTGGAMLVFWRRVLMDFQIFAGFRHKQTTAVGLPDHFKLRIEDDYSWVNDKEAIPFKGGKLSIGFVCRIGIGFKKGSGNWIGPYERF